MFPDIQLESKPRLAVGNVVRVLKEKTLFEKGYKQSWSDNCFKIHLVKQQQFLNAASLISHRLYLYRQF